MAAVGLAIEDEPVIEVVADAAMMDAVKVVVGAVRMVVDVAPHFVSLVVVDRAADAVGIVIDLRWPLDLHLLNEKY